MFSICVWLFGLFNSLFWVFGFMFSLSMRWMFVFVHLIWRKSKHTCPPSCVFYYVFPGLWSSRNVLIMMPLVCNYKHLRAIWKSVWWNLSLWVSPVCFENGAPQHQKPVLFWGVYVAVCINFCLEFWTARSTFVVDAWSQNRPLRPEERGLQLSAAHPLLKA